MDNKNKVILHLCADTGSDVMPYEHNGYRVIMVGKQIGVENWDVATSVTCHFPNSILK